MSFDGGSFLTLAFLGRLLVKLATAELGKYSGLFAGTLEATQGGVEIFVFFYADTWHKNQGQ